MSCKIWINSTSKAGSSAFILLRTSSITSSIPRLRSTLSFTDTSPVFASVTEARPSCIPVRREVLSTSGTSRNIFSTWVMTRLVSASELPAGSSLAETNRVITHVEKILREVPEVESTSRRTGMQLGLASVTEANTGDVSVKLRVDRSRGIDEVIEEVRSKIKAEEPALDVEFIQILQDMIGDLTSAPEPVQIKLFAQDPVLLADWAPKVADSISKIKGIVDVFNGIDNTISGPAVT